MRTPLLAAFLLIADGALAQTPAPRPVQQPAQQPAQQQSAQQSAEQSGELQPPTAQVIGRVTKVDARCGTLSVRDTEGVKALQTTPKTRLVVDGVEQRSLGTVKEGQQMRASFERGGPPVLIEVRSKGRFEPSAPPPPRPTGRAPAGKTPPPNP